MQTIVINGDHFSTLDEFFDEAERKLTSGLDWKVAHNFDAFNDILYGGFGAHESRKRTRLIWKNSEKSRADLSWEETVKYWESKVITFSAKHKPYARQKLEDAKNKVGQTMYEFIREIINDHENIELVEK